MRTEHRRLMELCDKYHPELIISDNRYGLWHRDIKSVLITHQLFPIAPKLIQGLLHRYLFKCFERFDEIWVPDYEGENNLSGKLSHASKLPSNVHYVGPLSRFERKCLHSGPYEITFLGIVSGPEPYREELFNKLKALFKLSGKKCIIVAGKPEKLEIFHEENVTIYNHLSSEEMHQFICNSRYIISRSGYSSIMDFDKAGRKAYLIPTPGQTEQMYLAEYNDILQKHVHLKNEHDLLKLISN
jgi:predicted glycosyltransferase